MLRSVATLLFAATLAAGCGPKQRFTDEDVPRLPSLGDIMWAQAQAADPLFKKIGAASYTDDEYTAMTAAASRLKLTSARIKADFSKGADFNALVDQLAARSDELAAASGAKDAARASAALQATKDTCRSCHKQFR